MTTITTSTQTIPETGIDRRHDDRRVRRLATGVAIFAVGAGLGWLGGGAAADPATVNVAPEAVSTARSADAVERSSLPVAPPAGSSLRSPDAVARSEAARQERIDEASCLRLSQGLAPC
jgi:hypothetical protein